MAAVEASLVISIDAQAEMPTVGMTLTTANPRQSLERFRVATAQLAKWMRATLTEDLAYLGFVEWTTGEAPTSGGYRRPHQHFLLKHVDVTGNGFELAEGLISEKWHSYTGAHRVECRPLRTPAGAIAYLTLHHHKKSQAPPPGFTGRRLRPSKNYYARPIADLRAEARELLRDNRRVRAAVRKATEELGSESPAIMGRVAELVAADKATPAPELVRVKERLVIDQETGEIKRPMVYVR